MSFELAICYYFCCYCFYLFSISETSSSHHELSSLNLVIIPSNCCSFYSISIICLRSSYIGETTIFFLIFWSSPLMDRYFFKSLFDIYCFFPTYLTYYSYLPVIKQPKYISVLFALICRQIMAEFLGTRLRHSS